MKVFMDYETSAVLPFGKRKNAVSLSKYSRHPQTRILCCAFKQDTQRTVIWVPPDFRLQDNLRDIDVPDEVKARLRGRITSRLPRCFTDPPRDTEYHAHNAQFEMFITENVAIRYGFRRPGRSQWRCTAAKAAVCNLPRALDQVAKALGLPIRKDHYGKTVMDQMCKPRKARKDEDPDALHWYDDDVRKCHLFAYCIQDVDVEYAVDEILPDLSPRERMIWLFDATVNARGIPFDIETIEQAIEVETKYENMLLDRLSDITHGEITSVGQVAKILRFVNERGVNIGNLREGTIKNIMRRGVDDDDCRAVLQTRQALASSATKKYKTALVRADDDGYVRNSFLYHGASTGRWAGAGVQPHNFMRGIKTNQEAEFIADVVKGGDPREMTLLYGGVKKTLALAARSMIKAPEGMKMYVGDFAQVEARALAWVTNQENLLNLFRTGADPYKYMAHRIYNVPEEEVNDDQRFMGKTATLGLGYQMGWNKFKGTCQSYGVEVSKDEAVDVVAVYRNTYPKIKAWWGELNRAALECVRTGSETFAKGTRFQLSENKSFLEMSLRSSRKLYYFRPRLIQELVTFTDDPDEKPTEVTAVSVMTVDSTTRQFVRRSMYGGLWAENYIQGLCRDFQVHGMLEAERHGYPICMHVHDEASALTAADYGSCEEFSELLSTLPEWGEGMPLAAEVWEGIRYRK